MIMKMKKFLGILFGLTMVVGLMVGMSMTAHADGTTYDPASTYTGFASLGSSDHTVSISGVSEKDLHTIVTR